MKLKNGTHLTSPSRAKADVGSLGCGEDMWYSLRVGLGGLWVHKEEAKRLFVIEAVDGFKGVDGDEDRTSVRVNLINLEADMQRVENRGLVQVNELCEVVKRRQAILAHLVHILDVKLLGVIEESFCDPIFGVVESKSNFVTLDAVKR